MEADIACYLAAEVKRELAERYFSMRRLIEDDQQDLAVRLQEHRQTAEQRVCFDLLRIYILLRREDFIQEFLEVTGLTEAIFFDPHLPTSPTLRARAFAGVKTRGLTRAGRFKNLFLDSYEALERDAGLCRENLGKLLDARNTLQETIRLFHLQNDLGAILNFLRCLDTEVNGLGVVEAGMHTSADLAAKLRIETPPQLESLLTLVPPMVPLPEISRPLRSLAERAWQSHGRELLASL